MLGSSAQPQGRSTYYALEPRVLDAHARQLDALWSTARASSDRRRPCS